MRNLIRVILFFILGITFVFPQDYGLRFKGQEYLVDERTSLNLTPNYFIGVKNEFELSFDIKLDLQKSKNEFGYIFRIISENNNNIDLLIKNLSLDSLIFILEDQEHVISISENIIPSKKWTNFKIKVFKSKNEVQFFIEDYLVHQSSYDLDSFNSLKVFFGGNDYNQFINYDVPKMSVKDIKIYRDKNLFFHLPLNQCGGDVLIDLVSNKKTLVKNPDWILCDHQQWELLYTSFSNGTQLIAPNEKRGEFYLLNDTHLLIFNTKENSTKKIPYDTGAISLSTDHRAFYNENDNKIYCYLVDREIYSTLDLETVNWTNLSIFDDVPHSHKFQHHNSVFYKKKNELYTFGGYGQYEYNNVVKKVNFNTFQWETQTTNDSLFKPRYLAGSTIHKDTIYILGGYGNDSGSQLVNPHSFYDLLAFDISTNSFSEKFKIKNHLLDMVVGNNICIDSSTRNYYALIHDKAKFNGYLKVLRGNLDNSETEILGDSIPFKFHDIKSFAGLYQVPFDEKLIAYSSYLNDNNQTEFYLHAINLPLIPRTASSQTRDYAPIKLILLCLLVLIFIVLLIYKTTNANKIKSPNDQKQSLPKAEKHNWDYNIVFFGGLQVFDKNKVDITNKFSPLLKELFLLLWMYTHYKNKGISSDKLEETLWGIKSDLKARNNRSVNIAKLRVLLNEIADFEISKKTGYWKLNYEDKHLSTDLSLFLKISKNKNNLTKNDVESLLEILKNGSILENVSYEWLDSFKADVNDRVIDLLLTYVRSFKINDDPDLILRITDCVFNFDSINELAVIYKTRAYNYKGNHSLAKSTFEDFQKKYNSLYGVNFKYSFQEILSKDFDLTLIS
ncbi:kelch repeat-containing protein [Winogradskyella sp.]|uniref:Kelch repeat-containing protein n=1 Tax=Winogradskyella sp. TaxID=1883156 RepID=UPI003516E110